MALGERNRNNQNGGYESPSILSSISFANSKSDLDKSAISFNFWRGFLKIDIAPLKSISDDGVASYDRENSIAIYLRPPKAYILLKEIEAFQKNPTEYKNRGVNSGSGLISISNGEEFGYVDTPCITIRKVNQDGETEASCAYVIRKDFHFAVRDYNQETHSFKSVYDTFEGTEIEMIKSILYNYVQASSSAYAAEVINKNGYAQYRISNDIKAIAQKLGVDYGNRNKAKSSQSYFASNNREENQRTSFQSSTVDDINNMIDNEEDED